jgi:hypothetical protein
LIKNIILGILVLFLVQLPFISIDVINENLNNAPNNKYAINSEIISNSTTIDGFNGLINTPFEILTNGNLSISNSILDFSNLVTPLESAIKVDNGGKLKIINSILKNGYQGIEGDSYGDIFLSNVTIEGFSYDDIDLKGDYSLMVENSIIKNGRNGIQLTNLQKMVFLTNVSLSSQTKDALNIENVDITIQGINVENPLDDGIQVDGNSTFSLNSGYIDGCTGDSVKFRDNGKSIKINNTLIQNGNEDGLQVSNAFSLEIFNLQLAHNQENGFQGSLIKSVSIINSTSMNNGQTFGNGIELASINQVYMQNFSSHNNREYGFSLTNSSYLSIISSDFKDNYAGGIEVVNINEAYLLNIKSQNNTGVDNGAFGLRTLNIQKFNLTESIFESNSGDGILVENSSGYLTKNNVNYNQLNGISIWNGSNIDFLENFVSSNFKNGISIHPTVNAKINYNRILNNKEWGIIALNRSESNLIDANYNYWGSDLGPDISNTKEGQRDDFLGFINISYILHSNNEIFGYTKPNPLVIDYQLIVMGIILLLIIATVSFIVYNEWLKRKWLKITNPHLLLLIDDNGIPFAKHVFSELKEDELLIAGFISAVDSFFSSLSFNKTEIPNDDITKRKKSMEEIKHGSYTLLIRKIENYRIVLVVEISNKVIRDLLVKITPEIYSEITKLTDGKSSNLFNISKSEKILDPIIEKYFSNYI